MGLVNNIVRRLPGGVLSRSASVLTRFSIMINGEDVSGISVNSKSALGLTAYWCGIRAISETVARCRLSVMDISGEVHKTLNNHAIHKIFNVRPNRFMSVFTFVERIMHDLLIWGNFYALILRDKAGRVVELWPLDPTTTNLRLVKHPDTGKLVLRYQMRVVSEETGQLVTEYHDSDDVLHIRGMGADGYVGYSPLDVFRQTFGLGIASRNYGLSFFKNGGRPSGLLTTENALSPEQAEQTSARWKRATTGKNSQATAVLDAGLKYQAIALPPEHAQFLQTRKFSIVEIAQILNMPPTKLHDLTYGTYSNVGQEALAFSEDTIEPWTSRIESEITKMFIREPEKQGVKFDVSVLLKGDMLSRYRAYNIGIGSGVLTREEARIKEGMSTVPAVGELKDVQSVNVSGTGTGSGNGDAPPPNAKS